MKRKAASVCFFTLAAAVVFGMFIFSSQDASSSSSLSRGVARWLAERLNPSYWRTGAQAYKEQVLTFMSHPVRKTAHIGIYALLGALLMGGFMGLRFSFPLRMLFSQIICTVSACADEYHQRFVSGRAGTAADVLLDSLGGLAGIVTVTVLCMAVMYMIGSARLRRSAKRRAGKGKTPGYRAAPPPGGGTGFGV